MQYCYYSRVLGVVKSALELHALMSLKFLDKSKVSNRLCNEICCEVCLLCFSVCLFVFREIANF